MKQFRKIATATVAALCIALAAGVSAQAAKSTTVGSSADSMHGSADMAMPGAAHGDMATHAAARQLMSTQELEAFHAKMKTAKTSEDRNAIAMAMQTELEKRAKEKGIKLPAPDGMPGDGRVAQSGTERSR